jgi:hypothetical protein
MKASGGCLSDTAALSTNEADFADYVAPTLEIVWICRYVIWQGTCNNIGNRLPVHTPLP